MGTVGTLSLFERISADIASRCPWLLAVQTARGIEVSGGHPVKDSTGRAVATFSVRIIVSATFPDELPVVFETGCRIPRKADRHVNPDASCCIGVPANLRKILGRNYRLSSFIQGPMNGYFLGQALVELGQSWPAGEARHGFAGIYDFWSHELGLTEINRIVKILRWAYANRLPRKNAHCPCGSGRRSRQCHRQWLKQVSTRYSPDFLEEQAYLFDQAIDSHKAG